MKSHVSPIQLDLKWKTFKVTTKESNSVILYQAGWGEKDQNLVCRKQNDSFAMIYKFLKRPGV